MNSQQVRDFIDKYKGTNARCFIPPSHLEPMSELFEVQAEAVVVRKDEFHELEGGKTYMPRKETLDKFARAAGVSYNAVGEKTRKEGDGCYVGSSQAMIMEPDGSMSMGDVCEYEFDVDVRLEEMKLNGKADWGNKDQYGKPGKREYSELELAQERVQLQKVARQRANTGARSRATLSVLGMQTGFKNLFQKSDAPEATRTFLFSRIIRNAKNKLVMDTMLANMGANVQALFGSQAPVAALPASPERNVTPSNETPFIAQPIDDWGEPEPAISLRAQELTEALIQYIAAGTLPPQGVKKIQDALDRGESDIATLEDLVARAKSAEEKRRAAS